MLAGLLVVSGLVVVRLGAVVAVARVDLVEQHVQGLVQVEAVAGFLLDQFVVAGDEFPQAGHGVAGLVAAVVRRQDLELGPGLGVQEEQDPVEIAQALAREFLREVDLGSAISPRR